MMKIENEPICETRWFRAELGSYDRSIDTLVVNGVMKANSNIVIDEAIGHAAYAAMISCLGTMSFTSVSNNEIFSLSQHHRPNVIGFYWTCETQFG